MISANNTSSIYLSKPFLLGTFFIHLAVFGYKPVTNYFYYGGGWPFVQIVAVAIYAVGLRFMFKSQAPLIVKLILSFWWIAWAMTSEELRLQ